METILGFTARLYEVWQLSFVPALVTRAPVIIRALEGNRPDRYNQDTTMADWYGAEVDKGDHCTFPPLSNYIRRRPHLYTQREETLPTRSEEEQTVVMTCRPNSKETPLTDVYWICVLCSLFLAL